MDVKKLSGLLFTLSLIVFIAVLVIYQNGGANNEILLELVVVSGISAIVFASWDILLRFCKSCIGR